MFIALCFRGYGKIKEEGLLPDWGAQRCLGPHFVLPQSLYFPGTGALTAHPRNPALHPREPTNEPASWAREPRLSGANATHTPRRLAGHPLRLAALLWLRFRAQLRVRPCQPAQGT